MRAGLTARPLHCRARVDGREVFDGRAWQVIVAGTGAFGGDAQLDAVDASDGLLDVAVLEAGSRASLARRTLAMRAGALTSQRGVRHARGREVVLDVARGTCFNVDGELCRSSPRVLRRAASACASSCLDRRQAVSVPGGCPRTRT